MKLATRNPQLRTARAPLFAAACTAMAMFGVVLVVFGTVFGFSEMRSRMQLDLVRQGDLLMVLVVGIWIASFVAGPLIDRFGNRFVLSACALLLAAGLAGLAFSVSFRAAAICALVLGLGGGGLNTSPNALVSDLYPDRRASMLNVLGAVLGAGTISFPALAAAIAPRVGIPRLLLWSAAVPAMCAVLFAALPFPPAREAHRFSIREAWRAARDPGVLLFGILLFFESGNESALNGWTTTWATSVGATTRIATLAFVGFEVAMVLGRVAAVPLLRRVRRMPLVVASGIAGIAAAIVLLLAHSPVSIAAGAFVAGFACAPIYQTVLAEAGDRYPRFAGTVFGTLFGIGLLGGVAYPYAMGHASQTLGLRSGIVFPLAGAAAICALAAVIMRRRT